MLTLSLSLSFFLSFFVCAPFLVAPISISHLISTPLPIGASLNVYYTTKDGKTELATEYMPGGMLSISIDAQDVQISEAFLAVQAIDAAYEMFVEDR